MIATFNAIMSLKLSCVMVSMMHVKPSLEHDVRGEQWFRSQHAGSYANNPPNTKRTTQNLLRTLCPLRQTGSLSYSAVAQRVCMLLCRASLLGVKFPSRHGLLVLEARDETYLCM